MSVEPAKLRKRHIWLMGKSLDILGHVLKNTTQEQASTLRDGIGGWTILEVVGHLRDYDGFFYKRAMMMIELDCPVLPGYNHEQLVIEHQYNEQDLAYVYEELVTSRQRTIAFFQVLTDEQWEKTGLHPERGFFTMDDAVMQIGLHDIDHLEQITRILEQELAGAGALPSEIHMSEPGDGEIGNS
jgi:hypothetical protein